MHEDLVEVVGCRHLVLFGTEARHAFLADKRDVGIETGDQDVESEIELVALDQQRPLDVFLNNILLLLHIASLWYILRCLNKHNPLALTPFCGLGDIDLLSPVSLLLCEYLVE